MNIRKSKLLVLAALVIFSIEIASCHPNIGNNFNETTSSPNDSEKNEAISTSNNSGKGLKYKILYSNDTYLEELSYIGNSLLQTIKEIIAPIDYAGSFHNRIEGDNKTIASFYRTLRDDVYVSNKLGSLDPEKCTYYYFDIDNDGASELVLKESHGEHYILKYDATKDEVILLETLSPNSQFHGDNKVSYWQANSGLTYGFQELYFGEHTSMEVRFHSRDYLNNATQKEESLYLVGFPMNLEINNLWKTSDIDEPVEACFDEVSETYYFRVTKEAYDELTVDFFEARKSSIIGIEKVSHTFSELFHSVSVDVGNEALH